MGYKFIIKIIIINLAVFTTQSFASPAKFPNFANAAVTLGDIPSPFGWRDFCQKYPRECEEKPPNLPKIELTASVWKSVQEVNEWANHGIEPVSDLDHWGVPESWDIPTDGKGDCEDYALLKRKALMRYGLPASVLLITVVYNRRHEGHAILTVVTDHGDLILDNQTDAILGWDQTGYRFIERQSARSPNIWVRLDDHSEDIVVSSRTEHGTKPPP